MHPIWEERHGMQIAASVYRRQLLLGEQVNITYTDTATTGALPSFEAFLAARCFVIAPNPFRLVVLMPRPLPTDAAALPAGVIFIMVP